MEMTYSMLQKAIKTCFSKAKRINFDCDGKALTLSKDGVVVIENFISQEQAEQIYNDIKKLLLKSNVQRVSDFKFESGTWAINRGKYFNSDFNMIDIFDIDAELTYLKKYIDLEYISSIISTSNGESFELKNFNVYYNNEVKPRCLHVDNFEFPQYKAFIYLTDVNEIADGPYCYVKSSHLCSEKKIKSYVDNFLQGNYLTDMRAFSYDDALKCIAKRGTLIISDQNGVHGAFPQEKGKERMLLMLNFSRHRIEPK